MSRMQAAGVGNPLEPLGSKLALHLESDFGVTEVGGKVAEWASRAGWRNTVVQATDTKRPTLVPNVLDGKPALRFVSSQQQLLVSAAQVGVEAGDLVHAYVVGSINFAGTNFTTVLASYGTAAAGAGGGWHLSHYLTEWQAGISRQPGVSLNPKVTSSQGINLVPTLYEMRNDPNTATIAINGVDRNTVSGAGAGGMQSRPDAIAAGSYTEGAYWLYGDLFSFIVLTNPTPQMRAFVMDYLADKYPSLGLAKQRPPLPASAVEYWHGELDASSASAVGQLRGTTLAGVNAPIVAADAGYFNGRPVYQANATGSKVWVNAALAAPLLAAGARPYMCAVLRTRSPLTVTGNYTSISLRGGTFVPTLGELLALILEGVAGDDHYTWFRYRNTTGYVVNTGDIQDTNVHFFEMYIDATLGMLLFVDGVQFGGNAETVGLVSAIDAVAIGCLLTGAGVGTPADITNTSLAFWLLCSSVPSAGERAALRTWAQRYWAAP